MASHKDFANAHRELESEKTRLLSELSHIGAGPEGALDYDANFADTSQVTAERGEVELLAAELKDTLSDVEAALGRLEAGTYGTCETCGSAISEARLEAVPQARQCISCATQS